MFSGRHEKWFSGFAAGVLFLLLVFIQPCYGESVGVSLGDVGSGHGLSLALNDSSNPAFSFTSQKTKTLYFAQFNGSGWERYLVDSSLSEEAPTALVFKDGTPHVFYHHRGENILKHAYLSGSSWIVESIPSASSPTGELSASLCGSLFCLTHYDSNQKKLFLVQGTTSSWSVFTVPGSSENAGIQNSIAADSAANPIIAFWDSSEQILRLAKRSSGTWEQETLELHYVGAGAHPKLLVDQDNTLHLSFSRATSTDLGIETGVYYARKKTGGDWEAALVSDDFAGAQTALALSDDSRPVIASLYRRTGSTQYSVHAVIQFELQQSGIWTLSGLTLPATLDSLEYTEADLNLVKKPDGGFLAAYRYQQSETPATSYYRLHGNSTNTFLSNGETETPLFVYTTPRRSKDSDGDGLSDEEEAYLGTDPLVADTDHDGISDAQEISDGSNPLDRGSRVEVLGQTLCTEWNGFLGGMWNVFEHVNLSNSQMSVLTTLFDINGAAKDHYRFSINAGAQQDVLIHGFSGRVAGSYGRVCSTQNASPGDLDGRMVYYKPSPSGAGYQFAFAMTLSNGIAGPLYVPFNTFQPSFSPADAENLVANWLQLTNVSDVENSGTLSFYDMNGALLGEERLTLAPGARKDYDAHRFGRNIVGLVQWMPNDETKKAQLRNVRYLYDNPDFVNSFTTAFQLEGAVGTGEAISAPLDTTNAQTSIVELSNTLDQSIFVTANFYDHDGALQESLTYQLAAKASRHIIANEILGNDNQGTVIVDADTNSSVIAVVMQYSRDEENRILSMHGIRARQALGTVLRGSYNTFLEQSSTLVLVNPSSSSEWASVGLVRNDGSRLEGTDVIRNLHFVPSRGVVSLDLTETIGTDDYGVVTVQSQNNNSLLGWVLRKRGTEYVIPTPIRQ